MPKTEVKGAKINVTSCKSVYNGKNATTGDDFTIYEIEAVNKQGIVIQDKLSSFSALPLGEGVYNMKPYYKDGVFKNWTIEAPKGAQTQALTQRIEFLEQQLEWLIGKVTGLEGALKSVAPVNNQQVATPVAAPDDDDIPF